MREKDDIQTSDEESIQSSREKITIDNSELIENDKTVFDKELFGKLVRNMIGKLSVKEFGNQNDISKSCLDKIIYFKNDNPPSKRTLLKLCNAKTEHQTDIYELVSVAGYKIVRKQRKEKNVFGELNEIYSGSLIDACYELQRDLFQDKNYEIIQTMINMKEGYFELSSKDEEITHVGIASYLKKNNIVGTIFAMWSIYLKLAKDAETNKIYYILTDDEEIYQVCIEQVERLHALPTVVYFTPDHRKFTKKSDILVGVK